MVWSHAEVIADCDLTHCSLFLIDVGASLPFSHPPIGLTLEKLSFCDKSEGRLWSADASEVNVQTAGGVWCWRCRDVRGEQDSVGLLSLQGEQVFRSRSRRLWSSRVSGSANQTALFLSCCQMDVLKGIRTVCMVTEVFLRPDHLHM